MKRTFSYTLALLMLIACLPFSARATSITVSGFTVNGYNYPGALATLRIYASETFVDSLGTPVVSGALGSIGFYKVVNCTVNTSTKVLTVPSFTITSTTDSSKPGVKFSGILYDASGARRDALFSNWSIPTSLGTSVTFQQLEAYNRANPIRPPPSGYYTADQVNTVVAAAVAAGPPDPNKNYALAFTGVNQMVDFDSFFTGTLDHSFFWEVAVKPGVGASSRYIISDGSGGGHAMLLGTVSDGAGAYQITGNVWDGAARTFGSDEGPQVNEWCLLGVGLDRVNNRIVTYYDGVPVGILSFSGTRTAAPSAGPLYVGGSDHQNWIGSISQIRGYEGDNPHKEVTGNNGDTAAYVPSTVFKTIENGFKANFLVSFLRPSTVIRDEGIGFPVISNNGGTLAVGTTGTQIAGTRHSGRLRGSGQFFTDSSSSVLGAGNATSSTSTFPLAQYELDTTAPTYRTDQAPTPPAATLTPAAVPGSAIVFDDFNRRNKTWYLDENGGLDSTVGGSAGALAWNVKAVDPGEYYPFGVLNGKAVVLANKVTWAYVNAGVASQDIRVDRRPSSTWGNGVSTGIFFRGAGDALNYWWAYTLGTTTTGQSLYVVKTVAGLQTTVVNGVAMPSSWTTLKVVTLSDGTVRVYGDSTLVSSFTDSAGASATRSGLLCPTTGRSLYYRWDDFTIFAGA